MTTVTNKVLEIALAKLRPCSSPRDDVWGASLSFSEIVALTDNGYRESSKDSHTTNYAKKELSEGKCGSTWCYFNKIGERKPKFDRVNKEK